MSTSTPPKPSNPTVVPIESQAKLLSVISLGALIVGPVIIALPPRKFDFYTIALLGGTFAGGNQVCHEYTGRSIIRRFKDRAKLVTGGELPEKARLVQAQLKAEKAARERRNEESLRAKVAGIEPASGESSAILEEVRRKAEADAKEKEVEKRRLIDRIWLGGEDKNWKEKRDQREREYLEDGRGYGALIMDQIWEVWTWGKDNTEEIKEKDEEILEKRKKEAGGK